MKITIKSNVVNGKFKRNLPTILDAVKSFEGKDVLITLFLSGLITYFFAGNYLFTNFSTVYKNLLFGFSIGYSLWKGNQFIGWLGNLYFPWEKNPKLTFTIKKVHK